MANIQCLKDALGLADDARVFYAHGGKSKSAGAVYAANANPQAVVAAVAGKEIQRVVERIWPGEGATWAWYSAAAHISHPNGGPVALAGPKLGANTVAGEALNILVTGGSVVVDIEYIEV